MYGLGVAPSDCNSYGGWFSHTDCWGHSIPYWDMQARGAVAPPPAPPESVWTVPPASGEDAQATVDALVNQQMADQKLRGAAMIDATPSDIGGAIYGAGSAVAGVISDAGSSLLSSNMFLWAAVALAGVIGLAAIGGGGPRRYGR